MGHGIAGGACMSQARAPSSLSTSPASTGRSAAAAAGLAFRPKLALGLSWKLFSAKLWVTAFIRSHSGLVTKTECHQAHALH